MVLGERRNSPNVVASNFNCSALALAAMLELTSQLGVSTAASNRWHLDTITRAVRLMGWRGTLRGPVSFGGVEFVAVCTDRDFGAPGSGWLEGCLVPEKNPESAMRQASLLAAYSSRAILVRPVADLIELQLQTALLDQGAVVDSGDRRPFIVSTAGSVVQSDLQDDAFWRTNRRWNALQLAISTSAPLGETG